MNNKLYLKDENGKTYQWWINFLTDTRTGARIVDIAAALTDWKAKVYIDNTHHDAIEFDSEEDKVWFLLHWS